MLLGNGFSVDAHRSFRYASLFDAAALPIEIRDLFIEGGTSNFEAVMRRLIAIAAVEPQRRQWALTSIEKLKLALVEALRAVHPTRPSEVKVGFDKAERFLSHFIGRQQRRPGRIFTTNYDLLLVWLITRERARRPYASRSFHEVRDGFPPVSDGSGEAIFDGGLANAEIVWLHGALHLYGTATQVKKITYKNANKPLHDRISERMDAGVYPVFVTEGLAAVKKEAINASTGGSNLYLKDAFRTYRNAFKAPNHAALFTIGHSLGPEDEHLYDPIILGRLPMVCLGAYGEGEAARFQEIGVSWQRRRAETGGPPLEVIVFDSSKISIWTDR